MRIVFSKQMFDECGYIMDRLSRNKSQPFKVKGFSRKIEVMVIDESDDDLLSRVGASLDGVILLKTASSSEQAFNLRNLLRRDGPIPYLFYSGNLKDEEKMALHKFALTLMGSRQVFRGY